MWLALLFAVVVLSNSTVRADRPGWQREEVDWNIAGKARIKAINYPQDKTPPLFGKYRPAALRKKALSGKAASRLVPQFVPEPVSPVIANVIDSPPIDGFVPWVAVSVTDAGNEPYELDAIPQTYISGSYLTANPQSDYAIGIFDTGASQLDERYSRFPDRSV